MKPLHRSALFAALLASAAACENGTTAARPPAQLTIVSGDGQEGVVGQELRQPLVVRVMDGKGRPVAGQRVSFRVTGGGGSVSAGEAVSDRDGVAQERWTLGTVAADSQRVEASAMDAEPGQAIAAAVFRASGQAAAAATIAPVQAQAAGKPGIALADPVAAVVHDAYGNPVPGTTVTWTVTSGGGSASPATSVSDALGVARTGWVLGSNLAAAHTLQASVGGSLTTSFTATAALGTGATVATLSGSGQTGPVNFEMPQPLVAEVRQNGVPVQGVPVQWTATSGTLSELAGGAALTDAQGRTSVRWTPTSQFVRGVHTATAQVQGVGTATFTGTVTAGPPTGIRTLGIAGPLPTRGQQYIGRRFPGQTFPQRFLVQNAYGPAEGVTVRFTSSLGSVEPATATTDSAGIAGTAWTFPHGLNVLVVPGERPVVAVLTATAAEGGVSNYAEADVHPPADRVILHPAAQTVAPDLWATYNASLENVLGTRIDVQAYPLCRIVWSGPPAVQLSPYPATEYYPLVNVRSGTPGTYTLTAACEPGGPTGTATLTVQ
ncbi:MAG TPA: Ig-like domain-containing protein [Longimicrobium sp.]